MTIVLRLLAPLLFASLAFAQPGEGWYRSPALHGGQIVFTSEGDLWRVPVEGGIAERLTTHPAEESQAVFSPDGRRVAFVAAYEGGSDVYEMDVEGGAPRRLSFDGGRVFLHGYTPAGEVLLPARTWRARP
jgi:tricorn protease